MAMGFTALKHLAADRVTTIGEQTVWQAVQESAAEYDAQLRAIMADVVRQTTEHQIQYNLPGTGTLQPLDEYGVPKPVLPGGHYTVGFPIQGGADAWGTTRVSRAMMTIQEAERFTIESTKRDTDWIRRHMLAAILDNTSWVYTDELYGALTVQPLANADAVTYVRKGTGLASTDTHYLFQAAAIADATNPFPTIRTELMEHPSNSGEIVVYAATSLVASIEALTNFVDIGDSALNYGVAATTLRSGLTTGMGETIGRVDRCWIVEVQALPAGYMIAHAMGAGPFVRMREYPAPSLQGFFPEQWRPNAGLEQMNMIRYAGFGIDNRVAAVAMLIGAGAYAIPAGFNTPLPV